MSEIKTSYRAVFFITFAAMAFWGLPAQAMTEWNLQNWIETFAARETQTEILAVESDAVPGVSRLEITRDAAGLMTGLVSISPERLVVKYSLLELTEKPRVLKKMDGHDVILVSLEKDFSPTQGGHANMRYLVNGMTGLYRNFRMVIDAQGAAIVLRGDSNPLDPESDDNSYSSVFNYLFLSKNTFLGKVIGIEKVFPEQR